MLLAVSREDGAEVRDEVWLPFLEWERTVCWLTGINTVAWEVRQIFLKLVESSHISVLFSLEKYGEKV